MILATFIWKIAAYRKNVDNQLAQNLDRVGVFLQREVVESFGSPPTRPEGWKPARSKKSAEKVWRGMHHSSPGEPPYRQSSTLARSITFAREGLKKLLVGSSLKPSGGKHSYAYYLEMGSPGRKLAARPYLRPAVRKNKRAILKMIAGH